MKILLAHDNRTAINQNYEIYTTGAFTENVFNRYISYGDELVFFSRVKSLENKKCTGTKIKNKKITVFGEESYIKNILPSNIKKLRKQVDSSDVVIVRLPSYLGLLTYYFAKKSRKKVAVEVVGCIFDSYWNHSLKGKILAPALFLLTRLAVSRSKYVVYVTSEFLQRRYPNKNSIVGCTDADLDNLKTIQSDKKIEKKLKKIGTVGAIDVKYKGHEYVIEALALLKKQNKIIEYHILGPGNRNRLENIAKKYNVSEQIFFYDTLSHDKVFEWMKNLDVYIQPSLTEGLPRVIIEAMVVGVPCVGTNVGGIPELINTKYLFSKKNGNSIARLLADLETDYMNQATIMIEKQEIIKQKILPNKNEITLKKFWDNFKEEKNV